MSVWFLLLPSVYQVFPWKIFSLGCEDVSNLCQQLFRRRTWFSKTEQGYGLEHMASSQRLSGGRVRQLRVPADPGKKLLSCVQRSIEGILSS